MFSLICWATVLWICAGSHVSLYFYIIEAQLPELEATVSLLKMMDSPELWDIESCSTCSHQRRYMSLMGSSKCNTPQVMLIKEAQGLWRSTQFIGDGGVCQRLVKSRIVCWLGEDKNTKGTGMDLNTGTYQCAF